MLKVAVFLFFLVFIPLSPSFSKVYMSRDKALSLAFPDADRIEKNTVFLSEGQVKEIEAAAKAKLDSKLYTFYVGKKGDSTLGYAALDTHLLRTQTETIMVVINPDGTVRQVEILAFFEPPDYMPGDRWINLFYNKALNNSLQVGRDIPNMTGATITSNAMTSAVRRIMAVFQVAVKGKRLS